MKGDAYERRDVYDPDVPGANGSASMKGDAVALLTSGYGMRRVSGFFGSPKGSRSVCYTIP
jgi:hypothetical protein